MIRAVIFANSQAIILLVGKAMTGTPTTWLEVIGACTAFGGAVLCSEDGASAAGGADSAGVAVLGDAIALGAGLSGVAYLIFAGASRQHFSLFMLMFLIMVTSTVMIILFQLIVLTEEVTFGTNPKNGIWGFLSLESFDRLPLEFINVVVWYVGRLLSPCFSSDIVY
jgi:drug/metabolite transporter (DMT)-like permease